MKLADLKKTALYRMMKEAHYTDEEAMRLACELWNVMDTTADESGFTPAPRTVDVPMGRVRK